MDVVMEIETGLGPYRAATPQDIGLPLPRRGLATARFVVAAITAIAWASPLLVLDGHGALPSAWARESAGLVALVVAHVLLVPFLGLRSAELARGRRLERAPHLLALALVPLVVAAFFFVVAARAAGASVEEVDRAAGLALASRLSALAPIAWFGSLAAASAVAVVVTGLAATLATIDRRQVEAPRAPIVLTLVVAAAWIGVSLPLGHVAGAAQLVVVVIAALVAVAAPSMRRAGSPRERVGLLRCALVAAVGSTLLLLLSEHALRVFFEARLSTHGGHVEPLWTEALVELARARAASAATSLLHATGAAACFLVPIVTALRGARGLGFARIATSVALVLVTASPALAMPAERAVADRVATKHFERGQLPLLRHAWKAKPNPALGDGDVRATFLVVAADGTTKGGLGLEALVASEPDTTFEVFTRTLMARLGSKGCSREAPAPLLELALVAPTAPIPELGPSLEAFLSPPTFTYDLELWPSDEHTGGRGIFWLVSAGLPEARLDPALAAHEATTSLADDEDGARRRASNGLVLLAPCLWTIRLVPRPDDTMQRVLDAITALERDAAARGCRARVELEMPAP